MIIAPGFHQCHKSLSHVLLRWRQFSLHRGVPYRYPIHYRKAVRSPLTCIWLIDCGARPHVHNPHSFWEMKEVIWWSRPFPLTDWPPGTLLVTGMNPCFKEHHWLTQMSQHGMCCLRLNLESIITFKGKPLTSPPSLRSLTSTILRRKE